ncbi:hypothetical protein HK105_205920 [Polyrhizophydium stewartii]|uniref:PX domain-containing protein n=1 Tax=Polyrhizophydium stewartii TaxID=2732419 RepID=A0ABR4N528_9FUNG
MAAAAVAVRPADPALGDVAVAVSMTTNLPQYARHTCSPTRSLAEFDRLHLHLMRTVPSCIAPAAPPRSASHELVLAAADAFLRRIAAHPVLRVADATRAFFESEFVFVPPALDPTAHGAASPSAAASALALAPSGGVSPPSAAATAAAIAAGIAAPHQIPSASPAAARRSRTSLFSFGSSSSSPKEVDIYFENARKDVDACETHVSAMGRINEKICNIARDLAKSSADVSSRLASMSLDKPPALAVPLRKMSKCFAAQDQITASEVSYRSTIFNDKCLLLLRANMGAQWSLDSRTGALTSYEAACKATQKKVQTIERLRASSSIRQDKVDAALDELAEAKRVEADCRETFKHASDELRKEFDRHRAERADDMEAMLDEYVRRQIDANRQLLAFWRAI